MSKSVQRGWLKVPCNARACTEPCRCSSSWGAYAPSRVLTGALAGQFGRWQDHQTVRDALVQRPSAGAPTTAREGACAPRWNCMDMPEAVFDAEPHGTWMPDANP